MTNVITTSVGNEKCHHHLSPPKTECGCLRGVVIENGYTRNPLTLRTIPVLVHMYTCSGVGAHTGWPSVFSWGTQQQQQSSPQWGKWEMSSPSQWDKCQHRHSEGNEKCHHHHSEINVNTATVREMRNIVITITVRDTRNVINVTSKVISVKAAVFFFIIFRKNSSSEIRLYSLKLSVSQFYRAVKTEDAQTQASTAAVYFREKRQKRTKWEPKPFPLLPL